MSLTRKAFTILEIMATSDDVYSQRKLENLTGFSLGTVNRIIREFTESGWVCDGKITELGLEQLEPYRAKRAVFIAAGFGSRLMPVTLNTPKPMVKVNGKRIIDGLIDACLKVGIEEIYIVRGYLAEQFDLLLKKYPMIKFIDNPSYNVTNNISSAVCAREFLENAYVCEADILIKNDALIKKYNYCSNVLGIAMERTDDWCFNIKDGYIASQQVGGINCFQEIGISYLNGEAGRKYASDILEYYDLPGGKEKFWDQVLYSQEYKDGYKIEVRECVSEDVVEIDTFNELKAIDKAYAV